MWETIGKYVGGKVLTAVLVVGSAASMYWFYRHPEQLETIWDVLKSVLAWLGIVLVLPWAGFFLMPWVMKFDTNVASGLLLVGYLLIDFLVAMALSGWGVEGTLTWMVLILGFLAAGVYNFLVCEYQAHRLEESL
ncbi:MAG: hypothetical protein IH988_01070 [Planctomycetes bacterium]|nr:hypothetical protein [Planctomycetota bacterium]